MLLQLHGESSENITLLTAEETQLFSEEQIR